LFLCFRQVNSTKIFVAIYYIVCQYFAGKMNRLVLLLAPAICIVNGLALTQVMQWAYGVLDNVYQEEMAKIQAAVNGPKSDSSLKKAKHKKDKRKKAVDPDDFFALERYAPVETHKFMAIGAFVMFFFVSVSFRSHCLQMSQYFSEPQIMKKMQTRSGQVVILDDYRESFFWLRDNTDEDARILSWWDYGYQINGIANRTTIADGNTWNHEHIGLLARSLVSPEEDAHQIVRCLGDYVWVFTSAHGGSFGDDIAKMPHIARIAGSVYKGIDGLSFYMTRDRQPSKAMKQSLLYSLHSHGLKKGVKKPKNYKLVFESEHLWVRIYKNMDVDQECREYHMQPPWKRDMYCPKLMKIRRQHKDFDDKNAKFDFDKGI